MPADPAVFAALGDPTRLALIERIAQSPASIVDLTQGTLLTRQAVTKHLTVLQKAGLAHATTLGRTRIWRLEPRPLSDAAAFMATLSRQWDIRLDRLRDHVESDAAPTTTD